MRAGARGKDAKGLAYFLICFAKAHPVDIVIAYKKENALLLGSVRRSLLGLIFVILLVLFY